ncbi:hypothetical protein [Frankia sp. AgW1.1]|uniref:hypothetical protein n=1 Tax=Frankia sp. AgW1.1 TaxID=1836971 RepID=UPI001EE3ECD7|nr:hypothetical protein [Frankia sp. AgW1.1]
MNVVLDHLDVFGSGLSTTLQLTALSFLLALGVGVVVATARVCPAPPLRGGGVGEVAAVRHPPPRPGRARPPPRRWTSPG